MSFKLILYFKKYDSDILVNTRLSEFIQFTIIDHFFLTNLFFLCNLGVKLILGWHYCQTLLLICGNTGEYCCDQN